MPALAGLSTDHLAALELPDGVRRLEVARDNDPEGRRAETRLRVRLRGQEIKQVKSCDRYYAFRLVFVRTRQTEYHHTADLLTGVRTLPALETMATFTVIVALIVVSPGPNLFLLLRNAPMLGRTSGLLNVLGICAAILTHGVLSLVGVSAIIVASATLFGIVKFLGAAYLIWLGIKFLSNALTAAKLPQADLTSDEPRLPSSMPRAVIQGWAVNVLNPKPALFYLAAFPHFIDQIEGSVFAQGMTLASLHAAIAALWYGLVVLGIDKARVWLSRPGVWRTVQSVSGLALLGLGARLAFVRSPNP